MQIVNKNYLVSLLGKKIRIDGRGLEDYRNLEITYDVSKNAEGSARTKIGETEVIAGVKMEIGTPYPDNPDEGTIIVSAEFLPLANPEFESGPPSVESIELSRVVDRGIRESGALDFKKLCIKEGEKIWMVLIDIYVLNDDGNLQDASALAALAALMNTKMPSYDIEKNVINYKERKEKLPLLKTPVECSTAKIGEHLVIDPGIEEEGLLDARLTVASVGKKIHAMQKGGSGTLLVEDIDRMIKMSVDANEKNLKVVKK
jgi:exosome complex component RRP42